MSRTEKDVTTRAKVFQCDTCPAERDKDLGVTVKSTQAVGVDLVDGVPVLKEPGQDCDFHVCARCIADLYISKQGK